MQGQVEQLLLRTLTPSSAVVKEAEGHLEALFHSQRLPFLFVLLSIVDTSTDSSSSLSAAIVFKNLIQKATREQGHWSATDVTDQNQEVKRIRDYTLHLIKKQNSDAINNALSTGISFMAKTDYPSLWPSLIHSLMDISNQGPLYVKYQVYSVMQSILRIMKSREVEGRKALSKLILNARQISPQLFSTFFQEVVGLLQLVNSSPTLEHLMILSSCQKIIQKMISSHIITDVGTEGSPTQQMASQWIATVNAAIPQLLNIYNAEGGSDELKNAAMETCDSYGNFIDNYIQKDPDEFLPYLSVFLEFFYVVLQSQGSPGANRIFQIPKRTVVCAINFYHEVLTCPSYRSKPNKPTRPAEIMNQFFTNERVFGLVGTLINKFMVLSEEEMEEWEDDPEGFANVDIKMDYGSNPKSASDVAYSTLLRKFPEIVWQVLNNMLETLKTQGDNLLLKEVTYWCISMSYHEIKDKIDFRSLFTERLRQDILNPDVRYKTVRRRICQIVENWSTSVTQLDSTTRTEVFESMLCLLSPQFMSNQVTIDNDYVVRFLVFGIIRLVEASTEAYTSSQLLEVISDIALVFGDKMKPYIHSIITSMLSLWKGYNKGNAPVLKQAVFSCWKKIVQVLKEESHLYFHLFIPAIMYATDVEKNPDDALFLTKDALMLWLEILKKSPKFTAPDDDYRKLMDMFPRIVSLFQSVQFEHTFTGYTILSHYLFGYRQYFLQEQAQSLISVIAITFSTIDPNENSGRMKACRTDIALATKLVDGMCIILSNYDISILEPLYLQMISLVVSLNSEELCEMLSFLVASLARFSIVDQQRFLTLFGRISGIQAADAFERYISVWLSKIWTAVMDDDLIRLYTFGISSLLSVDSATIHNHFPTILSSIAMAIPTIRSSGDANQYLSDIESEVFAADKVAQLPLSFISTKITDYTNRRGLSPQQILSSLDPIASSNIQSLFR
ncbi:importin-11 [Planoprotostelium fungivorum]|uniref:Importin-11 n=1 Tax=Planoprotostelium fungivorum TaxID=1890364 RepID=A0A2P6NQZ4_9EUKA|nr:importin-11 [Planoprotostelium fungivorum]